MSNNNLLIEKAIKIAEMIIGVVESDINIDKKITISETTLANMDALELSVQFVKQTESLNKNTIDNLDCIVDKTKTSVRELENVNNELQKRLNEKRNNLSLIKEAYNTLLEIKNNNGV